MSPWWIAVAVWGQAQGPVFTLTEARARALELNPSIQASEARLAEAEARLDEAASALRPQVDADVEASASPGSELVAIGIDADDRFVPPESMDAERTLRVSGSQSFADEGDLARAFRPIPRYQAQVGVRWNLYDFGRTRAAVESARKTRSAREASRAAQRARLLEDVDGAYVSWLAAWEQTRIQRRTVERLGDRLADVESRIQVGTLSESALWPLRTDLAAARLQVAEAEQVVDDTRLTLEAVLGEPVPSGVQPDVQVLRLGADAGEGEAMGAHEEQVLSLQAQAARAEARATGMRPRLGAQALVGLRGQDSTPFPVYQARLTLHVPLWDGGQGRSQATALRARAQALSAERQGAQDARRRRETQRTLRLRHARNRVRLAGEWLQVSEQRLLDAESRYAEGAATSDELARARSDRAQAELELLVARVDRTRAYLGGP